MNYTNITLGELLSSDNPAIKRNATGILKQLQKGNKRENTIRKSQFEEYQKICKHCSCYFEGYPCCECGAVAPKETA